MAEAQRAHDGAIEASVSDPDVTVPRVDDQALQLAEKRAVASARALDQAAAAVTKADSKLKSARDAFEGEHALELGKQLYEEVRKSKVLAQLMALHDSDHVRAFLFERGIKIGRDRDTLALVLHVPGGPKVASLAEACANSVSPKAAPAVASYYRAIVETERATAPADAAEKQPLLQRAAAALGALVSV